MQPQRERRDDAEVSASPSEGPEQIGVLGLRRPHGAAVGQDDLGLQQVVDGESVPARQIAVATAECQAADPGGGDDPRRSGEAVHCVALSSAPRVAPPCTRAVRRSASTSTAPHRGQIDDDASVYRPKAGAAVTAAAHCDRGTCLAARLERRSHVVDRTATGDERGTAVDHGVVDGTRLVVLGVIRTDDPSADPLAEAGDFGKIRHDSCSSVSASGALPRVSSTTKTYGCPARLS